MSMRLMSNWLRCAEQVNEINEIKGTQARTFGDAEYM